MRVRENYVVEDQFYSHDLDTYEVMLKWITECMESSSFHWLRLDDLSLSLPGKGMFTIEGIKKNKNLKRVDFNGLYEGDTVLNMTIQALKQNETLQHLEIGKSCLKDHHAEKLAECLANDNQALTELHLRGNEIGDPEAYKKNRYRHDPELQQNFEWRWWK